MKVYPSPRNLTWSGTRLMPPPPSLSLFLSHASPSYPLHIHHTFPSLYVTQFIAVPPFLPPFLPSITLVDETSPVDEPLNSDQVTEGVQFAYTLPQQQSNMDNDTALVGVHPCVCVCTLCVGLCAHTLYGCVWGVCLVAQGECWRQESHLSEHAWTKGCLDS